ncbi:LysR family transcriptional regulator [Amycolatopsis sp. H20-H5]|uniref:LysR family transcriptional regulator n=1 Tax=Amycolatopsis sp. H20-H5 TaxID=3046309 RepID=UPI002DBC8CCA|nr:LysR family transcriptional regulator [Amycolatopsis sp. H20-H5]MEC3982745.1 LysR family transcriptional regulator [Amycolatopsis sp. H20-H5]
MAELELRHLRAVRAVADSGSVSKASTLLGISQPALTAQLKRIERILGGELFERSSHGTRPTALGGFVLGRADALLADMRSLVVSAQRHSKTDLVETLRVGYVPLLIIGRFIEELHERIIGLDVQTWAEPAALTLLKLLSTGRVDVALMERFDGTEPHHFEGLGVRPLATEPIFVGIAEGHPAIMGGVVRLADLAGSDWILPPPHENAVRLRFQAACEEAGFAPRIRHYSSEGGTAGTLIAQGAVCLAQAASAPPPGLLALPLAGDPLWTTLLFVTREDHDPGPMTDEVFRCAVLAYRSSVDRNPHFARWWRLHPELQEKCTERLLTVSSVISP